MLLWFSSICFLISEPPSFVEELMPFEVVKGSTAAFACKVAGTTPFQVMWFKNQKPIAAGPNYIMTDSECVSLTIQDVQAQDVGTYQCTVVSEVGSCTSSAALTLTGWL